METELVRAALAGHHPEGDVERADLERLLALVSDPAGDPWDRSAPLHLTGSALVLHPPSRRVLLRWHHRVGRFLHVGGHGDPGEEDPFGVALREAREETGLEDLAPWPGPEPLLVQVEIVHVPPRTDEPAHEHGDLRYLLATAAPERAAAETERSPVVWRSIPEALAEVGGDGLSRCLRLVAELLEAPGDGRAGASGQR